MQKKKKKKNQMCCKVSCSLPKLNYIPLPVIIPDSFMNEPYDVEKKLMKTNVRKATGADNIPNWILHDCAGLISKPLAAIFNASIREGYLPLLWELQRYVLYQRNTHPKRWNLT